MVNCRLIEDDCRETLAVVLQSSGSDIVGGTVSGQTGVYSLPLPVAVPVPVAGQVSKVPGLTGHTPEGCGRAVVGVLTTHPPPHSPHSSLTTHYVENMCYDSASQKY